MRISDWSSDVCSSDLQVNVGKVSTPPLGKYPLDFQEAALLPAIESISFGRFSKYHARLSLNFYRDAASHGGPMIDLLAPSQQVLSVHIFKVGIYVTVRDRGSLCQTSDSLFVSSSASGPLRQ